jgi:hypothetical protein
MTSISFRFKKIFAGGDCWVSYQIRKIHIEKKIVKLGYCLANENFYAQFPRKNVSKDYGAFYEMLFVTIELRFPCCCSGGIMAYGNGTFALAITV